MIANIAPANKYIQGAHVCRHRFCQCASHDIDPSLTGIVHVFHVSHFIISTVPLFSLTNIVTLLNTLALATGSIGVGETLALLLLGEGSRLVGASDVVGDLLALFTW